MGHDSKGQWIKEAREAQAGVILRPHGGFAVSTKAALKAIPKDLRQEGVEVLVTADNSRWIFAAASVLADTTDNLVVAPNVGAGRWLRADQAAVLKIPFSFANTDDEVIFTVPAGFAMRLTAYPFLDIATSFAGGASSSFGISTNITGYTADGALVGVTLEAAATEGVKPCTIGAELPDLAHFHALLFVEGSVIEYNRVVSAFTAGAADLCLPVAIARV
jgi:hypothetical protein